MPRIHALFCLCVCALSVCFVVFFSPFYYSRENLLSHVEVGQVNIFLILLLY